MVVRYKRGIPPKITKNETLFHQLLAIEWEIIGKCLKVELPIPSTVIMKAEAWLNVKVQYCFQYPNRLQSYNASIDKIVVLTKLEPKESVFYSYLYRSQTTR